MNRVPLSLLTLSLGGKTSLINGIIDELSASTDTYVAIRGSVALVSQTAFILNATLRENILFGRAFDSDLYERVLDACWYVPPEKSVPLLTFLQLKNRHRTSWEV